MKTAMQELIEWIDSEIINNPNYDDSPRIRTGAEIIKVRASVVMLNKEKEQLKNAFMYALKMRFGSESQINTGEDYFKETYTA